MAALVPDADVVHVPRVDGHLPLAAARNAGVARARALGAELLVLLDVDCLPETGALARYAEAAAQTDGVLCGPVGYLPPAPPGGYPVRRAADAGPAAPGPTRARRGRAAAQRRARAVLVAVVRADRRDLGPCRRLLRRLRRLRRRGHRLRAGRRAAGVAAVVGRRRVGVPPAPRRPAARPPGPPARRRAQRRRVPRPLGLVADGRLAGDVRRPRAGPTLATTTGRWEVAA